MPHNPSWLMLKNQITEDDDFNTSEKADLLEQVEYLEQLIGSKVFEQGNQHPIFTYLVNSAPWTRRWFWDLGIKLKAISKCENFDSVAKRMQGIQKFYEALSVADIAYSMLKQGFEVVLEPQVLINNKIRKPDHLISNPKTGERVYIEASGQHASQSQRDANNTFERLTSSYMFKRELVAAIDIHKILNEQEIDVYLNTLNKLATLCQEEKTFKVLEIPGVIDAGFAHKEKSDLLDTWEQDRGLKGSFSGPVFELNTLHRIKTKIKKEVQQLPPGDPGILILHNPYIYSIIPYYKEAISELYEIVLGYPNLYCLVVYGSSFVDDLLFEESADKHMIYRNRNQITEECNDIIVVYNQGFKLNISQDTVVKIDNAIMKL